jgi:beta-glucosidase
MAGKPDSGTTPTQDLITQVAPYRKTGVRARTDEEIRTEVEAWLRRMTIQDKLGQMSQCVASDFAFGGDVDAEAPSKLVAAGKAGVILGALDAHRIFELQRIAIEQSPLKIPLLFNADVIHGFQTIFPVPLAWSCSWDMEAIQNACRIAAREATATGIHYNNAPMVDITRDPRWGRVMEGAGEDPYLGAQIAVAQVRGFQGDSLFSEESMIACLKHFAGYGAVEGGRDYNTVDISEWALRNVYLPPFKAGIEAGAGSVMTSFTVYQGIPAVASQALVKGWLREEMGFDGLVISDYAAVDEVIVHGCARDGKEAAQKAIDATLDIEMVSRWFYQHLPELVAQGLVAEAQVDAAVRRILTYKYHIGIMDDPFRYVRPEKEREYHFCAAHLDASRDLARKSIVLLKNDSGVLPLTPQQKIAVVGPFANSKDLLGRWQFTKYGDETVTLLQGLAAKGIRPENLMVAEGCGVESAIDGGFNAALQVAQQADVVLLAMGESSTMSGEAASRTEITLPEIQLRLAELIVGLGKPTVLVLTNGRPLILDWFQGHVDAILETWFLGSQAGNAIADVLLGDYNPAGRLTMSFPAKLGQVPVYYSQFKTGRPMTRQNQAERFISKYIDGPNDPLYPFGYGLSYTRFSYSDLKLDREQMTRAEAIRASVTVTNTGDRTGEETVQLYIQDLYGSTVRPVKELKGFQKITLNPGESREVVFTIREADLRYYTADMSYQAEPGEFTVYLGPNSRDVAEAGFTLV